jgi:hypothetical protein
MSLVTGETVGERAGECCSAGDDGQRQMIENQ